MVNSRPSGARVLLNGREIGTTPLKLKDVVPYGSYQLALSHGQAASFTRVVTIGRETASVVVSYLAVEAALLDEACFAATAAPVHLMAQLGERIGVRSVLFVRAEQDSAGEFLVAGMVDAKTRVELRQGRFVLGRAGEPSVALGALVWFLATSEEPRPVPESLELVDLSAVEAPAALAVAAPPPPEPWYERGWVWAVAGGVVAVAAGAIVTAAVLSQPVAPKRGVFRNTLTLDQ